MQVATSLVVTLALWTAAAPRAGEQASDHVERGWVGLFTPDLVGVLENENMIASLCPQGPDTDGDALQACRDDKLAPRVIQMLVRESPTREAPAIGAIIVVAAPGEGLDAYVVAGPGGTGVRFTPDEHDRDWGYGPPYFHQTFVERRGTWFRLPKTPFAGPVWIDTAEWPGGHPPNVLPVKEGSIYESPRGDLFVLSVERDGLVARAEQDADSPCGVDEPVKPAPSWRIPWPQLYDPDGHLLLHVKYTRGC